MGSAERLTGRKPRARKAPAPLCNCQATAELYGKTFPHRAGKVRGCHMDPDGEARDGIPRPGCSCRACASTNARLSALYGTGAEMANRQEDWGGVLALNARDWETAQEQYEGRIVDGMLASGVPA